MGTPSTRSSAGTVSSSRLLSGVFDWGPLTVSMILSGIARWNLFSSSSEILPWTRSGLSAEAGEPPASSEYPRRPSPANANTATTSAANLLWYVALSFFIVLDLLVSWFWSFTMRPTRARQTDSSLVLWLRQDREKARVVAPALEIGGARTVAGAAARLSGKPVSARPGLP